MPGTPPAPACRPHRAPAAAILLALLAAVPGAAEEDLPLPTWNQDEWRQLARESAPPPLGGLLPNLGEQEALQGFPAPPGMTPKYPDGPPALFPGGAPSLDSNLSLFLPDFPTLPPARQNPMQSQPPTAVMRLRELTPEFLAAAAAWPQDDPLIDPGFELAETQAEDLRRFLGYHAEESEIPIVVLLMARDEILPSRVALERLAQGSLLKRRAALLVYPFGEPWRARLFLPRAAHESVSTAFLTRMVEACLVHSSASSTPEDQLHDYVVQLSIRLFWLQNELGKTRAAGQPLLQDSSKPSLAEVGRGGEPESPGGPAVDTSPAGSVSLLRLPPSSLITLALSLGILLAIAGRRVLQLARANASQRRHTRVWVLPEKDIQPRFGGAFCGGGGAWGSWK